MGFWGKILRKVAFDAGDKAGNPPLIVKTPSHSTVEFSARFKTAAAIDPKIPANLNLLAVWIRSIETNYN